MVFAFLRTCARNFGLHFKKLLWCLRSELGEITARHHFHVLIGGLPHFAVRKQSCFALMAQWEKIGGGMARVYPFSSTLDGVEYVLKGCEEAFNAAQSRIGASEYELTKFGGSCDVMLSESLVRELFHKSRDGWRNRGPMPDEQAEGDKRAVHTEQKVVGRFAVCGHCTERL